SLILAVGAVSDAGSLAAAVVLNPAAEPSLRRHHARVKLAPCVGRATSCVDRFLVRYTIKASAEPRLLRRPQQGSNFRLVRRFTFSVPERRNLSVLDLAAIGIGADLLDRLSAVGQLHQFGRAAFADADLGLEQFSPLCPAATVTGLERLQVLAGGDVML